MYKPLRHENTKFSMETIALCLNALIIRIILY